MSMKMEWVFVTPSLAIEWLARNTHNRPLTRTRVTMMADDMVAGQWKPTHHPIAFNCDGSLKDGQHRLNAVVRSGAGQWFWVTTGLPDDSMDVIDTGRIRSTADVLALKGAENPRQRIAVATTMLCGLDRGRVGRRIPRHEVIAFAERHAEAISWVVGREKVRGMSSSLSLAPVARAWYTQDRDRLDQWFACLKAGVVSKPEDSAAAACYRFLLTPGAISGGSDRRIAYAKITSALRAFVHYKPLAKLYEATEEPFPIPD